MNIYIYVQDTARPGTLALMAHARDKSPVRHHNMPKKGVATSSAALKRAAPYNLQVHDHVKSTGGRPKSFLLIVNKHEISSNNQFTKGRKMSPSKLAERVLPYSILSTQGFCRYCPQASSHPWSTGLRGPASQTPHRPKSPDEEGFVINFIQK